MKGRHLRPCSATAVDNCRSGASGFIGPVVTPMLAAVLLAAALSACGGAEAAPVTTAAAATTEADDPRLVTTTAAPTTTLTAPTSVAAPATIAPTTVETLPTPLPPPGPRDPEPYIELGMIEIPKIGLNEPLLNGISLTILDQGPGHWPGTAAPGQLGNAVVAGHRTSHGKEFGKLDELVPGDEVIFTMPEGRFVYLVRETTIVKPDAMYIIEQTYAKTATLFACHPPGSTRERIVVHLDLLETEPTAASTATG
jgi:sortase A